MPDHDDDLLDLLDPGEPVQPAPIAPHLQECYNAIASTLRTLRAERSRSPQPVMGTSSHDRWFQQMMGRAPFVSDSRLLAMESVQIHFRQECRKVEPFSAIQQNRMHNADLVTDPWVDNHFTTLYDYCLGEVMTISEAFYVGICCRPFERYFGGDEYRGHVHQWRSMSLLCASTGDANAQLEIALLLVLRPLEHCLNTGKGGERRGPKDEVSFFYVCTGLR
jgi:hypothetical protein